MRQKSTAMKIISPTIAPLLILSLAASLHSNANAKPSQSETPIALGVHGLDSVLPENRARLFERVRTFVRAERNRDWATQYDLIPPELKKDETKEAFAERHRKMEKDVGLILLLDIEITDVTLFIATNDHTAGMWGVSGCALYHEQYLIGNQSYDSTIDVRLHDKEWFISGAGPDHAIDGPSHECRFHKKRGILAQKGS